MSRWAQLQDDGDIGAQLKNLGREHALDDQLAALKAKVQATPPESGQ